MTQRFLNGTSGYSHGWLLAVSILQSTKGQGSTDKEGGELRTWGMPVSKSARQHLQVAWSIGSGPKELP